MISKNLFVLETLKHRNNLVKPISSKSVNYEDKTE